MSSRSPSETLALADAPATVDDLIERPVYGLPAPLLEPKRGYRFAPENLLLAELVRTGAGPGEGAVLDLGAGSGILGLLAACAVANKPRPLVAVEVQPALADLTARNAARMGVDATVHTADLREAHLGAFPIVVANPPFFDSEEGQPSRHAQVHAATHALRGGVEAFAAAMARHLDPDGTGFLVYPADRLARALCAVSESALHTHALLVVWARHTQRPHRIWLMVRARPGQMQVTSTTAWTAR